MSADDRIRQLEQENRRLRELLTQKGRAVSNPALASYYEAVDRRIAEFGGRERERERTWRMWIASEVKQALGIKRLDQLKEQDLDKALAIIHKFGRYPSWDQGRQLCTCELCLPDLKTRTAELRERLALAEREYGRQVDGLRMELERAESALNDAHSSHATNTA